MGKTIDAVFRFLAVIAAALLLFITLSIGWSILARAIGVTSPVWTVQFTEYSLLWMTFLGTAWLLAKNKHIAISVLTQRLGRPANRTLGFIHSIVGALLCGSLCFFGAKLTLDHLQRHVVDVQAIDMPKGIVIVVIPIGFALLTVQFLRNFWNYVQDVFPDEAAQQGQAAAEGAAEESRNSEGN